MHQGSFQPRAILRGGEGLTLIFCRGRDPMPSFVTPDKIQTEKSRFLLGLLINTCIVNVQSNGGMRISFN